MKCEKSRKREMLTHWGMTKLGNGWTLKEVEQEMKRKMRLTIDEIADFVSAEREPNGGAS